MTKKAPKHLKSWLRRDWYADDNDSGDAAHPNSRYISIHTLILIDIY